jgi:hypothetical protein
VTDPPMPTDLRTRKPVQGGKFATPDEGLAPLLSASPTLVTLRFKRSLDAARYAEVEWPPAWRIPEVNDRVTANEGAGHVREVTFDLQTGRVILDIR